MHPAEIRKKRDKTPDEALAALMRLCARAEKSEGDARRLMRGWGVAEKDAEQVLGRLVRDRFIDDSRYAEAFVREKLRLSGWGEYKIRTALQRKGVSKERIDAALSQADRPAMGERLAQQLERKARYGEIRLAIRTENQTDTLRAFARIRLRGRHGRSLGNGQGDGHMQRFLTLLLLSARPASGHKASNSTPTTTLYPLREL